MCQWKVRSNMIWNQAVARDVGEFSEQTGEMVGGCW